MEQFMKHSWKKIAWVGLMTLLPAGAAFAQPEQWLRYHTSREGRGYRWINATNVAPAGVVLPKGNAPAYFVWWTTPMDPAGGRWLCMDRTRKAGPYDRLYLDRDGDGKLELDKPVDADRVDPYFAYFPPIRMTFKGEDGPVAYDLVLRSYAVRDKPPQLLFSSGGWYEGEVDIGGRKRRVELIDGNVNGTFNDVAPGAYDSDRVRIEGDKVEERFLARMIEVDGQLFRIEVARDGAFVKLQKAEGVAFGRVHVPPTISSFTAFGENGHFVREPDKGDFTLPEGRYRVLSWKIDRKDDKGAAWTLEGYRFPGTSTFDVVADKAAALRVGEPVRALFAAESRANGEVNFSLQFQGQMGESIEMLQGGQRPRGPHLTVTNLDGSFKYSGAFEFG
jgi:hypothetical protein